MNFVIGPEDSGRRLDVFLASVIPEMTRSRLQVMNRTGAVRVNGRVEKAGYKLHHSDRVEVSEPPAGRDQLEPEEIPVNVLYQDPAIAVIEKPAGMVVHPGAGNPEGTLVHALLARFTDLSDAGGVQRPGIVHRIDKLTSGLMVVARTNEAHHRVSRSFQHRDVEKGYIAGVHGVLSRDAGEIQLSIRRHPRIRTRMAANVSGGRTAHSEYRVLERGRGFSLLDVTIHTGRTHQIRVHLSSIGYPVVGDRVYGQKYHEAYVRKFGDPGRYFLHAARLGFPHPTTGEMLRFEAPLPRELVDLWARLKSGRQGESS